jgi:enterochelin esterase-like enzyme
MRHRASGRRESIRVTRPMKAYWLLGVLLWASAAAWPQRAPLEFQITWVNPPAEQVERVTHRVFRSESMGRDVGFSIYLPRAYDTEPQRRFPVIYWLHGAGGNESFRLYHARLYDQAIGAGVLPPAIVVFPNGGRRSEYCGWRDQNVMAETMIIRELIPLVDRDYRTIVRREGRALEGMSMGGNGALKLAFKYPELFTSVVAYAGSYRPLPADGYFPGISEDQRRWIAQLSQWYSAEDDVFLLAARNLDRLEGLRIRFVAGTKDVALDDGEALHQHLLRIRVPHEYEMLLDVPHDQAAYYRRAGRTGFAHHAAAFAAAAEAR